MYIVLVLILRVFVSEKVFGILLKKTLKNL